MRSRLALRPDLTECALEDRTLLAYSPTIPGTILTTGGYIMLTTPPGLSSALNSMGSSSPGSSSGGPGGSGGNMATSFNISGFGATIISIGNVTGYAALAGGAGRGGIAASGGVGGGGGGDNSTPTPAPRNAGFGATFSSGYSTSLDASNNYGMSTSPIGSIPVHTYDTNLESPPPPAPDNSVNQAIGAQGSPALGGGTPGNSGQGPVHLWDNLLGKKPGTRIAPSMGGPGSSKP